MRMGVKKKPSTKAELIAAYGEEWYANFLKRNRERLRTYYHAHKEQEREKRRKRYNPEVQMAYYRKHREVYRINIRDYNRLKKIRDLSGLELHHLKYHADNKDASWIDDIVLLTPEEHDKWHSEHPDFRAEDNIVR